MKTKEIQSTFEDLTKEFKSENMRSYEEDGLDYKTTKEKHKEFVKAMKKNFYDKLKKHFNITITPDGEFDRLCTYEEKLLLSEDEKRIIKPQKQNLASCATKALDVSSEAFDLNQSDEFDTRQRKTHALQTIQPYRESALTSIYSYSSLFKMCAADFYANNTKNLLHLLSTRNYTENQLQTVNNFLSNECRKMLEKDTLDYRDMIAKDTNRSFQDLSTVQDTLFNQMSSVLEKTSKTSSDFFEVLSPEERKQHIDAALADFKADQEKAKENSKDKPVQSLPDCVLE